MRLPGGEFFELLLKLINIWKNEITNEELQKIDPAFLDKINGIISRIDEEIKTAHVIEREILTQTKKVMEYILKDLKAERLSKLAIVTIYGGIKPVDISWDEKTFVELLEKHLEEIKKTKKLEITIDDLALEPFEVKKEPKRILCIAEAKIGDFIGDDLFVYRGIRENTVIFMPEKNLEIFIKRGARLKKIGPTEH